MSIDLIHVVAREVEEVQLERDTHGMCTVSLLMGKTWVPVIKDNGDIINHVVTASGIARAQDESETP